MYLVAAWVSCSLPQRPGIEPAGRDPPGTLLEHLVRWTWGAQASVLHRAKWLFYRGVLVYCSIKVKVKVTQSCPALCGPMDHTQSKEFYRPEYYSGLPWAPPGDLPDPGIEPRSPTLQVDSSPAEPCKSCILSGGGHWRRAGGAAIQRILGGHLQGSVGPARAPPQGGAGL